jgi:hypothetical protein
VTIVVSNTETRKDNGGSVKRRKWETGRKRERNKTDRVDALGSKGRCAVRIVSFVTEKCIVPCQVVVADPVKETEEKGVNEENRQIVRDAEAYISPSAQRETSNDLPFVHLVRSSRK